MKIATKNRSGSERHFTDEKISTRLDWLEGMIAQERDPKNLPNLNKMFQRLIDEQVRRELEPKR